MSVNYPFKKIENKWQDFWEKNKTFKANLNPTKKCYVLEMLPYPSGKLHMGHVRNYTIGDTIARFKAMNGLDVLHPMGWDAFGLPAENAAIENKERPDVWTYKNINEMKKQLAALGFSYDWDREFATCMSSYYKHEQRLFIEMYSKGLVYQKESYVNWDPVEQTVLANEQVVNGKGWRSGAEIQRKKLKQWNLAITKYAEELLNSLKALDWPEKVLKMQENWIGRSEGAFINFKILGKNQSIKIYTTRPETIFGGTFIAISPMHPLSNELARENQEIKIFIEEFKKTSTAESAIQTKDKQGIATGLLAEHPFDKSKQLPIYLANFVLMEYGTGALFGCPAHDERDFDFASKYDLPIIPVFHSSDLPYLTSEGRLINSDFLNGLDAKDAKEKVTIELEKQSLGKRAVQYRLRDWGVSRQRYWGCPIPMIYCDQCGVVPEKLENLPIELPLDINFDGKGNPLDKHPTWKYTVCPKCQNKAIRETDTFDTFFESSWYFLRYCDPNYDAPVNKAICDQWMPVDYYIGGIEHAVMHLLYARFFVKVLRDLGYVSINEPFKCLLTQGMVCHNTYKNEKGQWIYPHDVVKTDYGYMDTLGHKVEVGTSEKMSKSKKNVVDPQNILDSYGADVARLFILSDFPLDKEFDWKEEGLDGCWRYINKIWRVFNLILQHLKGEAFDEGTNLKKLTHLFIKDVTEDYEKHAFNKVIAHHREFLRVVENNYMTQNVEVIKEAMEAVILSICPIAPHIAYEMWSMFKNKAMGEFPVFDPHFLVKSEVTIVVQVGGKKRAIFNALKDETEDKIIEQAEEVVQKYLAGQSIKKTIVVANRMVNFVI